MWVDRDSLGRADGSLGMLLDCPVGLVQGRLAGKESRKMRGQGGGYQGQGEGQLGGVQGSRVADAWAWIAAVIPAPWPQG